jgi:hypothetical protein
LALAPPVARLKRLVELIRAETETLATESRIRKRPQGGGARSAQAPQQADGQGAENPEVDEFKTELEDLAARSRPRNCPRRPSRSWSASSRS